MNPSNIYVFSNQTAHNHARLLVRSKKQLNLKLSR